MMKISLALFTSSFADSQPVRLTVIVFATIFLCDWVTLGVLLIFSPDLFLRFFDWQNRGEWTRTAEWRKDVHNMEWKLFGVLLATFCLFFLVACIRLLLRVGPY